jgi:hypothetical protein
VISVSAISLSFNNLDGLAQCPLSHTCTTTLELSTTEFDSEFRAVLADPYFSCRMDAL